jgi:hypothetical protein
MNTELVVAPEEAKKKGADKQEETQTHSKRENKAKTLRMISTAYNNVAACQNL